MRFRRPIDPAEKPLQAQDERGDLFDEALLVQVRRLSLTPRSLSSSGLAGEHRSLRRGVSPEFADFKAYSVGDDYRRIDWNIYSRLGSLFVRLSEVTTDISVHILLDASQSMAWSGSAARRSKFTAARQISGLLAYLSLQRFDRVSITPFSDRFGAPFGPEQGRSGVQPMLRYVSSLRPGGATDLTRMMEHYLQARKRPGFLLLVSDLMSGEPEEFGAVLRAYRGRGWDIAVLHIVDPAELDPALFAATISERGALDLVDVESRDRLRLALSDDVVDRCREATRTWQDALEAVCRRERTILITIDTSHSIAETLRQLSAAGVVG